MFRYNIHNSAYSLMSPAPTTAEVLFYVKKIVNDRSIFLYYDDHIFLFCR